MPWQMRHTHGGIGGVHMLAALATRAVGVNAQVFKFHVHIDGLVDFGRDVDGGERGVAALGGVEGRDAHQAMDTALAGQLPKGIFSDDGEGGGFDARLFAVLIVVHLGFEACCSAQRRYMRSSISAQSWLSVPPAPG